MASNATLTPMAMAKSRKKGKKMKGPPMDVQPKDGAFERNFTKDGKPRLSAAVDSKDGKGMGEGAMGQRR